MHVADSHGTLLIHKTTGGRYTVSSHGVSRFCVPWPVIFHTYRSAKLRVGKQFSPKAMRAVSLRFKKCGFY